MRYEWDPAKNLQNQRKHNGISFELASLVFEDEGCCIQLDRIDNETGEQRWRAVGMASIASEPIAILLVIHVYRENYHGEETIRIISARAANQHDIRRYQEQAMD